MTLVNKVQPLSVATGNAILDFMCGPRFTSGSNIGTVIILFNLFILGKGIPKETAMQLYQQDSSNAQLKRLEVYGDDSLHRSKELQETQNAHFFFHYFPSFREIFESVMSGDERVFQNAVLYHIYFSEVLQRSL